MIISHIDEILHEQGMSCAELAGRLEIDVAMLRAYRKGTTVPGVERAYEIAYELYKPVEEVFEWVP